MYTFSKYQKFKKLIKYPLLKQKGLVTVLGEITWILNYYYPEIIYCPTLFFFVMLLVNFMSKEKVLYMVKTMIEISTVGLLCFEASLLMLRRSWVNFEALPGLQ